ncbi:ABC transporter substrate-binding protein [Stutzerimonas tarimensis]|uniref:ABC transporter substrate-binding protein n=1 Tax=Stutzerimonas tarimensis TaxID=1507735 RepID=A0ABV7TCD4_9GAMM
MSQILALLARSLRHASKAVRPLCVSLIALLLASGAVRAEGLPILNLSVLQFGTAHWELDHLQRHGLDRAHGFELKVRLVADVPASRLAVTSGSADGAVSDVLWAQARHEAGTSYLFVPFSSQIGEVMVAEGSGIEHLAELVGKRLGVAGGPDGQGWLLLQRVAREQGIDLAQDARVQFGAPPLLAQALRRDQVDALLTFWHFAARMRGEGGVRTAFTMDQLLGEAGLQPDLPVLGYLFPASWAERNAELLQAFHHALRQAKEQLARQPDAWQAIRPLMRAEDDAVFLALRDSFVSGIPSPLDDAAIDSLYDLLLATGARRERLMPAGLFHRISP